MYLVNKNNKEVRVLLGRKCKDICSRYLVSFKCVRVVKSFIFFYVFFCCCYFMSKICLSEIKKKNE